MVKRIIMDVLSQKDAQELFGEMAIPHRLIVTVMVKDFLGGKSVVNGPEKDVPLKGNV